LVEALGVLALAYLEALVVVQALQEPVLSGLVAQALKAQDTVTQVPPPMRLELAHLMVVAVAVLVALV
jgi:hypothetical protein